MILTDKFSAVQSLKDDETFVDLNKEISAKVNKSKN